jgi:DNA-binding MarR family transcriptional regulator
MARLKQVFSALILFVLCAYSTWKGMQTLAIFSIILFLVVIYKNKSLMIYNLFFNLARQAKKAKFGNFEVSISETLKQSISENLNTDKDWVKAIFSDLSPTELTVLIAVEKAKQFHSRGHMKNTLRALRDKGLVKHNKSTLEASDTVWLTDLGLELVKEIFKEIPSPVKESLNYEK